MSQPEEAMNLESLERVYTNYSPVYDKTFGKAFNQSRESAVRGLRIVPNDNVLEVGVGTGMHRLGWCGPCFPDKQWRRS